MVKRRRGRKRGENKKEKVVSVLGLDLSLTATGWCRYTNNIEAAVVGLIKTKVKGVKRLHDIRSKIDELIFERCPNLIVIEGYSFGSRGRAIFSIGELGGVIKLMALKWHTKTIIIPPTSLKKFITGKGNSGKEIMIMKTFAKYGIEFTNNNECDAFGLAMMGKAFIEGTDIKYEQEALKGVEVMT